MQEGVYIHRPSKYEINKSMKSKTSIFLFLSVPVLLRRPVRLSVSLSYYLEILKLHYLDITRPHLEITEPYPKIRKLNPNNDPYL